MLYYYQIIIGDIGNGAIWRDDYRCESNGEPPIGAIVPQPGEPIAIEGEVCCGPATNEDGLSVNPNEGTPQVLPDGSNPGVPADIPGNGNPTVAYLDVEVSPEECEEQGGEVVGDIGNGAIFEEDYVCPTNGEPPFAVVVRGEGEPIAIEGEVCCGTSRTNGSDSLSAGALAGIVVGSFAAVMIGIAAMLQSKSPKKSQTTAAKEDAPSISTDEAAETEEKF